MKHKLAVLTVLGALVALAVPAGSSATTLSPASAKFEIVGGANGPRLKTSLGSCVISKIAGQVPKSPENHSEFSVVIPIATPTIGSCSSGMSATLAGTWSFTVGSPYSFSVISNNGTEAVTLRFSSLPGCKLISGALVNGFWLNGAGSSSSAIHPHRSTLAKWANDGASCALAGQTEALSWEATSGSPGTELGTAPLVANLTTPSSPILLSN